MPQDTALPELLTIDEAAALARVHRDTMDRWLKAGTIPEVRVGTKRRVRRSDIIPEVTPPGGPSTES